MTLGKIAKFTSLAFSHLAAHFEVLALHLESFLELLATWPAVAVAAAALR